ncbi:unnamed protein product [Dibothriocephalus latus]|uniref:Uncharacterized protein n=1 Tax=Dibothriocephalus latus TaxID=60516 RepID=A0A3P7L5A6_DIBLA|nr:unnamed protein product [Dibothriocephalus latus]
MYKWPNGFTLRGVFYNDYIMDNSALELTAAKGENWKGKLSESQQLELSPLDFNKLDDKMSSENLHKFTVYVLEMIDFKDDIDCAIPADILDDFTCVEDAQFQQQYRRERTSSTEAKVIKEEAEAFSAVERAIKDSFRRIKKLDHILEQTVRREEVRCSLLQLPEKVNL